MSIQNFACGLPSKPRSAQPCMFSILSMHGRCPISQSRIQQQIKNPNDVNKCAQSCCLQQKIQSPEIPKVLERVNQLNIQNKPQIFISTKDNNKALNTIQTNFNDKIHVNFDNEKKNQFKKSSLFPKQIKHELNSYEKPNLKQSRAKSTILKIAPEIEQNIVKKQLQDQILDQKTIKQRKRKIKQFQIFTRQLPNSAFTTYYGKPAFEAYGRGASCSNLKTSNVMPHKGQNNPKNLQTHYNALIKGRQIKCKSYMPRKPIEEPIKPANHENRQDINVNLPLQKPNLVKSMRFSQVKYSNGKKQPVPYQNTLSTKTNQPIKPKNNLTITQNTNNKKKKSKKQTNLSFNDGLKYMNKRQNLINLIQQKKLKSSQLAFKVTECYPLQWNCSEVCSSYLQNYDHTRPAGVKKQEGDHVKDIFQGKKILQQSNMHIVRK